jgi:hypothetical protein
MADELTFAASPIQNILQLAHPFAESVQNQVRGHMPCFRINLAHWRCRSICLHPNASLSYLIFLVPLSQVQNRADEIVDAERAILILRASALAVEAEADKLQFPSGHVEILTQIVADLEDGVKSVVEANALYARIQASQVAIGTRYLRPHIEHYGPVVCWNRALFVRLTTTGFDGTDQVIYLLILESLF